MLDVISTRVKELYKITNSWDVTLDIIEWLATISATELACMVADYLDIPRPGWTYPVSAHTRLKTLDAWRDFATKGD